MCEEYDKVITLTQVFSKINKEKDVLNFTGELLYNNEKCGTLFGELKKVATPKGETEKRTRKFYFNLCVGNIISEGLSDYDTTGGSYTETIILGGTDEFEGVSGKIITDRKSEGKGICVHELYINW
jgi:hypothetical protein